MNDLITVIVPVYNVEKYLEDCIKSIINQTYANIEIILVDDGSTDGSLNICKQYATEDSRITIIQQENHGVSYARNKGIEIAKGNYITFIDSDDWIEKEFIETLYNEAKEKKADVTICGYNRIIGKNKEKIHFAGEKHDFNSNEYSIKVLNPQTGFGFCHMKLIKRKCIDKVRFDEGLTVGEDALFNMEIAKNIGKAILVEKRLYNYRINENSVVKKFDNNYVQKYFKFIQKLQEYICEDENQMNEIKVNYYNCVAYHVLLIAVNYCYHPDNKENRRKILKEICNIKEFKEGIKKSNYENLTLTRKISLFSIKHKLYVITGIICKIRQKQNTINAS